MARSTTAASRGTLTLDAQVLADGRERAGALGLRISLYVAMLVRNELLHPTLTAPIAEEPGGKRMELPLSIPAQLRKAGSKRAFKLDTTFSRLVEALMQRDCATPNAPFVLLAGKI